MTECRILQFPVMGQKNDDRLPNRIRALRKARGSSSLAPLEGPVEQAKRLQDAGINADADVGVPGFDPLQCRARREGALGYDRHRQPSASTGIMDVRPKLAQRAPHRSRRVVWSGHFVTFALPIDQICSTKIQFF